MADYAEKGRVLSLVSEARHHLEKALDELGSARGWGLWDILGGGFLSTLIKHGHMDDAEAHIREAQRLLEMAGPLNDQARRQFREKDHRFARLADWLFDGTMSDLYMQSCIADRRRAVERMLEQVERLEEALLDNHCGQSAFDRL